MDRDSKQPGFDETVGDTHSPRDPGDAPTLPATDSSVPSRVESGARYRLGVVLGRGGMGEVRSAYDEQIGRPVAIKQMRDENPSPEAVARFLREARIQGRLEHPAVVPVHEVWEDARGRPVFVMKQLAGTTLAEVLAGRDPARSASRQRLLRVFAEVCLAIEFAHTRSVVHRDLKPANIMLGDFGEVYVLDWGIARIVGEPASRERFADVATLDTAATAAGALIGTPGYMAPEQVRGEDELDGRADIYALGAILFEILAGEPLHPRDEGALASTLAEVDARPSRRAPERDIPPELDAICERATRADRAARFATARDLGDAVQRFLDGDRDGELRRRLASEELAAARSALEAGEGAAERRAAIRAAARALALAPTSREPAELVGRLMIEPPPTVPDEVEDAMVMRDIDAMFASRRMIAWSALVYPAFLPLLYWSGVRELRYFVAVIGLAAAMAVTSLLTPKRQAIVIGYTGLFGNVLMTALLAWITTPFLSAPAIAVVIAMVSSTTHAPIPRGAALVALLAFAVLSPWLAEVAGLVEPITSVTGNAIVLRTAAVTLDLTATLVALLAFVVVILAVAVGLARGLASDRRVAHYRLEIQSWQLRQLVPRADELASLR